MACCVKRVLVPIGTQSGKGLTAYVDYLYSTYLVVQDRLSYDDSIYIAMKIAYIWSLTINMTYD